MATIRVNHFGRDLAYCLVGAGLGSTLLASGLAVQDNNGRGMPAGPPTSLAGLEHRAALAFVVVGLAVLAWWFLSLLAALCAEALRRSGHSHAAERAARFSPAYMRRAAAALLGAQLVLAPVAHATGATGDGPSTGTTAIMSAGSASAGTAAASTTATTAAPTPEWKPRGPVPSTLPASAVGTSSAEGVPVPDWKPSRPAQDMDRLLGGRSRSGEAEEVTVIAGDSLWAIAARSLGDHATDAEVAHEWPRWYRANRDRVGADPDLLSIGTVLIRPPR